ncbi:hypothetical protein NQ318_012106, partial [Aromia moschata]
DADKDEGSSAGNDIQKAHKRKTAAENLVKQAKKMKTFSDKSHPPANVGDNVTIPIQDFDKGKGDLRNIIGVILQTNGEGFYKIGTEHGILQKLYCRSEFDVCTQKFLEVADVKQDTEISLRTAAPRPSGGTGQGFLEMRCIKNCSTNRCKCKKIMMLCNSKCHQSTPCKNK